VKHSLLAVIKLYWTLVPKKNRRPCLFKETCSQFIYRQTKELGFFEGTKAFLSRFKKCRSGYKLYTTDDGFVMELNDGSHVFEKDMSHYVLNNIIYKIDSKACILIEDLNSQNSETTSP